MSLPPELYQKKKKAHYDLIAHLANHLAKTATSVDFMGDNWEAYQATAEELLLQSKTFDKTYRKDYMIPEEPRVQSMTQWKHGQLNGVG